MRTSEKVQVYSLVRMSQKLEIILQVLIKTKNILRIFQDLDII